MIFFLRGEIEGKIEKKADKMSAIIMDRFGEA